MSIEAMRLALDALQDPWKSGPDGVASAITALRAAIEQPLKIDPTGCYIRVGEVSEPISVSGKEPYDQTSLELCGECGWKAIIPGDGCLVCARQKAKPVAYADSRIHGWPDCFVMEPDPPHTVPLYTGPREWVELTDDEARALVNRATFGDRTNWQALVYIVDAKLKEKNAA